jgi:hypothetical protein
MTDEASGCDFFQKNLGGFFKKTAPFFSKKKLKKSHTSKPEWHNI